MEQAKNRRRINDLFKTKSESLAFKPHQLQSQGSDIGNEPADSTTDEQSHSDILATQLVELESLLFAAPAATDAIAPYLILELETIADEL